MTKRLMTKIPLFYPYIPKKEILKEISDTLSTRYVGQGPKVDRFEKEFGKQFKYKYPLFVNSGTSALELAYHLIGLKAGDEVIVPVFNCTAGLMGLKRLGVKIVFADIGTDMNVDIRSIEDKITPRTKAIVVVNMGGIPVNPEIYTLLRGISLPIITDSAQHLSYSIGEYVVHSFQAIKHITTGDGGMLVLRNKKEYDRAKKLRWFGVDRTYKASKSWLHRDMTNEPEEVGYKFQPTDIDACFGLASLPHVPRILAHRKKLGELYKKLLTDNVEVIAGGSYWLVTLLCLERDALASYLEDRGIETNLVHLRNDAYKIFGGKRENLPNMNFIEDKYLCLPINPKVTVKDVQYISKTINQFYEI